MNQSHQLNQYIRTHAPELPSIDPDDLPENPLLWLSSVCPNAVRVLVSVLTSLFIRGATVENCALYATNRAFALPFKGSERADFEGAIAEMLENENTAHSIDCTIGLLAIAVDRLLHIFTEPIDHTKAEA